MARPGGILTERVREHLRGLVAERALNGGKTRVHVWVGTPRELNRAGQWECPYAIAARGKTALRCTPGIDAVQALLLAFAAIRADLKKLGSRVSWFEGRPELGFPRQVPEDLGVEEAIERVITVGFFKLGLRSKKTGLRRHPLNIDERKRPMKKIVVHVDDILFDDVSTLAHETKRSVSEVASDLLATIAADDVLYGDLVAYRDKKKPGRTTRSSRAKRAVSRRAKDALP